MQSPSQDLASDFLPLAANALPLPRELASSGTPLTMVPPLLSFLQVACTLRSSKSNEIRTEIVGSKCPKNAANPSSSSPSHQLH